MAKVCHVRTRASKSVSEANALPCLNYADVSGSEPKAERYLSAAQIRNRQLRLTRALALRSQANERIAESTKLVKTGWS